MLGGVVVGVVAGAALGPAVLYGVGATGATGLAGALETFSIVFVGSTVGGAVGGVAVPLIPMGKYLQVLKI